MIRNTKRINPLSAGLAGALVCGLAVTLPLSADESGQREGWPVEMSDYTAWSLEWDVTDVADVARSSAQDAIESDASGDFSQWALEWDLNNVELIDIFKTIQWLGVPSDERIMRLGSVDANHPFVRSPPCYRAVTACDSA